LQSPGKWDNNQTMSFRLVVALMASLLAFSGPARAQQDECRQRIVPVHVATRDGAPPPTLTAAHFQASVADQPVRVTTISEEQKPRRLIILLDASGSVRGGTTAGWDATVEVAAQLLAVLPPLEIGLALFSEEVEPVLAPTAVRERLIEEVERLRAGPRDTQGGRRQRTALWDSLLDSARIFGPLGPGDVLYVITDGVDNFSETRPGAVTQALLASGIRLFAFAIANQGFAYGSGDLERIVEDTGGVVAAGSATDWRAFRAARNSSPIGSALYAQHRQILSFHRVELELPETIARPQLWRLALTGLDENQISNVVLKYPARLYPCGETR
jgi:von Willebrand factor type A domain